MSPKIQERHSVFSCISIQLQHTADREWPVQLCNHGWWPQCQNPATGTIAIIWTKLSGVWAWKWVSRKRVEWDEGSWVKHLTLFSGFFCFWQSLNVHVCCCWRLVTGIHFRPSWTFLAIGAGGHVFLHVGWDDICNSIKKSGLKKDTPGGREGLRNRHCVLEKVKPKNWMCVGRIK